MSDLLIENFKKKNRKAFILSLFAKQEMIEACVCFEFLCSEIIKILVKNQSSIASLIRIQWMQDELQKPKNRKSVSEIDFALIEILKFLQKEQIEHMLSKAANVLYEDAGSDFSGFYKSMSNFFLEKNILYFNFFKLEHIEGKDRQIKEIAALETSVFFHKNKNFINHLTLINEDFLKKNQPQFLEFHGQFKRKFLALTINTETPIKYVKFLLKVIFS